MSRHVRAERLPISWKRRISRQIKTFSILSSFSSSQEIQRDNNIFLMPFIPSSLFLFSPEANAPTDCGLTTARTGKEDFLCKEAEKEKTKMVLITDKHTFCRKHYFKYELNETNKMNERSELVLTSSSISLSPKSSLSSFVNCGSVSGKCRIRFSRNSRDVRFSRLRGKKMEILLTRKKSQVILLRDTPVKIGYR